MEHDCHGTRHGQSYVYSTIPQCHAPGKRHAAGDEHVVEPGKRHAAEVVDGTWTDNQTRQQKCHENCHH